MNKSKTLLIAALIITIALLLVIAGNDRAPKVANTLVIQTVEMTQVVTQLVTQDITRETTRIVEVPVTVTPAPTLESTFTPAASTTEPTELPQASLPEYTDCLYGPASWYVYKTSFPAGQRVEVMGRSTDGNWINIEEVGGWNSCWISATQAQLQSSRIEDLPVVKTMLPRSEYEFGSPQTTTTKRDGDEVTVSWEAVYMSADEIQGYLIEASVCQGGQLMDLPVFVPMTFEENVGTISIKITDEAGCEMPSTAHIISMGKRGFAEWEKIFWPAQ